MGRVTVQITGDEAKMLKAIDNVIQKERKLAQEVANVGDRSEHAMSRAEKAARSAVGPAMVNEIGKYIGAWKLVETGIGAAQAAMALFSEQHKKITEEASRSAASLASKTAGRGDIMLLPQVRRQLQSMTSSLTMANRESLYSTVGGALPSASNEDIMAIVRTAAQGGRAGMSQEDMMAFGSQMGELRKVFRNLPVEDLADITKYAGESFGRRGQRFTDTGSKALLEFTQAGAGTGAEGLAFMLSMLEAGASPDQLGGIVDTLQKVEPKQGSKLFTKSKELKHMSMAERFKAVTSSDEYAEAAGLQAQSSTFAAIRTMDPAKHLENIQNAARRDYFTASQAEALSDTRFRESYFRQQQEAEAEIAMQSGGRDVDALKYESMRAYVKSRLANNPIQREVTLKALDAAQLLGASSEGGMVRAGLGLDFQQEFDASQRRSSTTTQNLGIQALPKDLEGTISSLNAASKNLENASRGGPTLAAPNEDR